MEFVVLGWSSDGPTLRLDYRNFAYAGKFVMSNTGKAVVREASDRKASDREVDPAVPNPGDDREADDDYDTGVVAALAFNADRTDERTLWYRYVTVRSDAKGQGLGPRLAAFVASRAAGRGYERLKIAVNNPFAYEALYKAGFGYTGDRTGIAELVLARPGDRSSAAYRAGLAVFEERDDLSEQERSFLAEQGGDPPAPIRG
jgi:GNAT superfamily N-acetyltransferase